MPTSPANLTKDRESFIIKSGTIDRFIFVKTDRLHVRFLLLFGGFILRPKDLTQGKITPLLIRFAIPYLFASLLNSLYGAVDIMIVGRFADAAAVAGSSIGTQINSTCSFFISGITMGGTVLLGQYIGAKREKEAGESIISLLILFSIVAVIVAPLIAIFAPYFVNWMQTPLEAVQSAIDFI